MKKFILTTFLTLFASVTHAAINQIPDQTLVSTAVESLHAIDSFVVSASAGGVSLFVYDDSLKQYNFLTRVYVPVSDSVTSKIEDSILVINSKDEKLHFVSVKNLPELQYLGTIDLQRNFADFTLVDNSLYIAGFYDGILRYSLTNYSEVTFIDSSMTGILVTQLNHDNQYLYALDEYNGLLRYDYTFEGFGLFDSYLYVPFRAFKYTQIDSLFYLHLINGGLLVGDFRFPHGSNIVDSLLDLNQIEFLYNTDSSLIFTDSRQLTTIQKSDHSLISNYLLPYVHPDGIVADIDTTYDLILPSLDGGLSFVTIVDTLLIEQDGLSYNGTIEDVIIDKSKLYLSNNKEAINTYAINFSGFTSFDYSLYEDLTHTGQMQHNGDSLFVIYTELEKLAVLVHADNPDLALFENSISISNSPMKDMYYTGEQLYDNALLFIEHPFRFDLYSVSDSGYISFERQWKFIADMTSFSFKDSIAVLTNRKNECAVYKIGQDYDKIPLTTYTLATTATESIFYGDQFFLFEGTQMHIFDFSDPQNSFLDTVISIPIDVLDAVIVEDFLFTVGNQGIAKYDLSGVLPEFVETGGQSGNQIVVDSNLIVIHDNKSVMLYYHELNLPGSNDVKQNDDFADLFQNYPNPFNLETVISYSLAQKSEIKLTVFNILGQNIKTLIHSTQDAGNHTITWDGTSNSGNVVSSGIYLYKLETATSVSTKKMVLLK